MKDESLCKNCIHNKVCDGSFNEPPLYPFDCEEFDLAFEKHTWFGFSYKEACEILALAAYEREVKNELRYQR